MSSRGECCCCGSCWGVGLKIAGLKPSVTSLVNGAKLDVAWHVAVAVIVLSRTLERPVLRSGTVGRVACSRLTRRSLGATGGGADRGLQRRKMSPSLLRRLSGVT